MRSAFLSRSGLTKEEFIGTGTLIGTLIDIARIGVYSGKFRSDILSENSTLLMLTTSCAFVGAYAGSKLLKKITFHVVQKIVSIALFILALALGAGVI